MKKKPTPSEDEFGELVLRIRDAVYHEVFGRSDSPFNTHEHKLWVLMAADLGIREVLTYTHEFIQDKVKDLPGMEKRYQEIIVEWEHNSTRTARAIFKEHDED